MYAIVKTGGKQYKAEIDRYIDVELLTNEVGSTVNLEVLMLVDGETVVVGDKAKAVKCVAEVLAHGKGEKLTIFRYKPKKRTRRKQGHRQPFTRLKIVSIEK